MLSNPSFYSGHHVVTAAAGNGSFDNVVGHQVAATVTSV